MRERCYRAISLLSDNIIAYFAAFSRVGMIRPQQRVLLPLPDDCFSRGCHEKPNRCWLEDY